MQKNLVLFKTCRGCGLSKSINYYYTHVLNRDGYLNYCKKCVKTRMAIYRIANLDKIRKYDKLRNKKRWESEAYRKDKTKYNKEYFEKHPMRKKAKISSQRLPYSNNCESCGASDRLHRHHPDYRKPKLVVSLCHPCHYKVHNK